MSELMSGGGNLSRGTTTRATGPDGSGAAGESVTRRRRRRAVEDALGSVAAEGLPVSAAARQVLESLAAGTLLVPDAIADPYLDLTHGVLKNRLGLTDPTALRAAEADITAVQQAAITLHPLPGQYDLPHLQVFHRRLFGLVYDWAGEIRSVALGKGGHAFCPPQEIGGRGAAIFLAVAARNHFQGLSRAPFLDALTDLTAALTDLHPFREGNGRAQRALLAQLVGESGYRLQWGMMDAAENIAVSRAAYAGDRAPLRELLDRLLVR